jgi:hypothetical protein
MRVLIKGAAFLVLLMIALGIAVPIGAQTCESPSSACGEPGSVIVFPKFLKGTVAIDGVTRAQTEIEVRARCPQHVNCPEGEPVKIKFDWICPGSDDIAPKSVCKEAGFVVTLPVTTTASFNPDDPELMGNYRASIAPCPKGYLIGWVISPTTNRPIKYDGLTGSAILRDGSGAIQSYEAIAIRADPNLAARADITTDVDPRTGTAALIFDGGAGHYQAVAEAVPAVLEYHKLTGPLSSSEAFLILLTLDVRVNRPNYPTFIDLNFRTDQGNWASTSWNFTCWSEIQNPNIDAKFTLAGARTRNGVVLSGHAVKAPFRGISDIPGPVTLLGLVPSEEGRERRMMDRAYIMERSDSSKPTTVFLPFN